MKNIKKVGIILVLVLMFVFCTYKVVNAFDVTDLTGTPINNTEATNMGNKIITAISTIGSIASVIVLVIIGIKYMLGSVEEKAQYKKALMPYFIGCIIVFAASFLAGVLYKAIT